MDGKRDKQLDEVARKIKFAPFYDSIKTEDFESLGIGEDEYFGLIEYFYKLNSKPNPIRERLSEINDEIAELTTCILLLEKSFEPIAVEIAERYGVEVTEFNRIWKLKELHSLYKERTKKYNLLKDQLPPTPKADETVDSYDILANLAMGLEMTINFDSITVAEFMAYEKVLKKKQRAIKEIQNGARKRKN